VINCSLYTKLIQIILNYMISDGIGLDML